MRILVSGSYRCGNGCSGVDRYPLVCWGPPIPTISFDVPIINLSLYSSQTINLTLDSALKGDFNNNNRVDIGDAAKISFYLAGKVDGL